MARYMGERQSMQATVYKKTHKMDDGQHEQHEQRKRRQFCYAVEQSKVTTEKKQTSWKEKDLMFAKYICIGI